MLQEKVEKVCQATFNLLDSRCCNQTEEILNLKIQKDKVNRAFELANKDSDHQVVAVKRLS